MIAPESEILAFELAEELSAREPPEARGLRRDQVRLLIYERRTTQIIHSRFDQLTEFIQPGDVLVLNNSRTLPAHLTGTVNGHSVEVRLLHARNAFWQCLISPEGLLQPGMEVVFDPIRSATVLDRCAMKKTWTLWVRGDFSERQDAIYRLAHPIQYEHLSRPWDLEYFQTVYAAHPGSVEMPSAGRAFSWELLFELKRRGVEITYITLHCGLSSMGEDTENSGPGDEEYLLSPRSAQLIKNAKARGARIIAVGTTVVRALESAAEGKNSIQPDHGWTSLHIRSGYRFKVVDGLLTGFHEPRSSHLELLRAFVGNGGLNKIYTAALQERYGWHEFGDANLIL